MLLSPDQLCRKYAAKKVRVTIRTLPGEEDVILVEGEREGLEFLGKLFLAQARASDCGIQLGPFGAGKALFTPSSTAGLYVHRLHKPTRRSNGRRNGKSQKKPQKTGA